MKRAEDRAVAPPAPLLLAIACSAVAGGNLAGCCAEAEPAYPPRVLRATAARLPLLDGDGAAADATPLRIELFLPLDRILDRPFAEGHLARLRLPPGQDAAGAAARGLTTYVHYKPIGHFSRLLCSYPKASLTLPGRRGADRRVFLVSHCNDHEKTRGHLPDEHHLRRHRLAYAMLAALGMRSLRVRPAEVVYVDSEKRGRRCTAPRPALLLEDAADLARRAGEGTGLRMEKFSRGSSHDLDPEVTARYHLFQILINNRDWKLYDLQPVSRFAREDATLRYLHNALILEPPGRRPLPVAFDLEISTLVGVPPGIVSMTGGPFDHWLEILGNTRYLPDAAPLTRWMILRLLHFEASHPPAAARAAVAHFKRHLPALRATIARATFAGPPAKSARRHLAAFVAAGRQTLALRRVRRGGAPLLDRPQGGRPLCDRLEAGTPLELLGGARGGLVEVRLVQYLGLRRDRAPTPVCAVAGRERRPDRGWIEARRLRRPGQR